MAHQFAILCAYSFVIGGVLFLLCCMLLRFFPSLGQWRDFWFACLVVTCIPLLFFLLPEKSNNGILVLELMSTAPESSATQVAAPSEYDVSEEVSFLSLSSFAWIWMGIYVIGCLVKLLNFSLQLQRLKKLITSAIDFRDSRDINSEVSHLLTSVEAEESLQIRVTRNNVPPFVCRWPDKVLMLPQSLFAQLSTRQQSLVIEHEWTHLKKKDPHLIFFIRLIECFCWFNPALYYFKKRIDLASELECDANVLAQQPDLRSVYAQAMLKTLRQCAVIDRDSITAPFSPDNQWSFRMRIHNIMHPGASLGKSWRAKVGISTAAALFTGLSLAMQPVLVSGGQSDEPLSMITPVKQPDISSDYGSRVIFNKQNFHRGIDYKADTGTPILAAEDGRVVLSTDELKGHRGYGKIIIIEHKNNVQTLYSHLNDRSVLEGEIVFKGQTIATVGATGRTTGPHVHFEVREGDKPVDPNKYLKKG
ncbi:M23/M56 family metallopeptidase [Pleionea sp. CnH1-48]|uniref:M23/M56 family metallopeptidase n=1 Tax=Pleionea sp. CnH1-48 TaxID=2954494 RepID=UPI00209698BA|nr:M23/M56 family metallopeptidase [Pleionea sp. CnH1-48]MCO7225116.1 M23/M56 family metallopeptidase [Pleionea sp. CnH1-48]